MQVPRHWREIPQRYRLEADKCKKCSNILFPGRMVCPKCGSEEFEVFQLSGKGRLITYTVIRIAPEGFTDIVPYAIGLIEMEEGPKIMAQIVDCDPNNLKTGDKLVFQFRKIREEGKTGAIMYGYKFVPDVGV